MNASMAVARALFLEGKLDELSLETFQQLIDSIEDINAPLDDEAGLTPLAVCCTAEPSSLQSDFITLLLDHGADPNLPIHSASHGTALHCAARHGSSPAVIALLGDPEVDLARLDGDGQTAVELIHVHGLADCVFPLVCRWPGVASSVALAKAYVDSSFESNPSVGLCHVQLLSVQWVLARGCFPPYDVCVRQRALVSASAVTDLEDKNTLFISHRWESMSTPDPDRRQFLVLQNFLKQSSKTYHYIWYDFSCTSQDIDSDLRTKHVQNVPTAAFLATDALLLPGIADALLPPQEGASRTGDFVVEAADLQGYASRAWCQAEALLCQLSGGALHLALTLDGETAFVRAEAGFGAPAAAAAAAAHFGAHAARCGLTAYGGEDVADLWWGAQRRAAAAAAEAREEGRGAGWWPWGPRPAAAAEEEEEEEGEVDGPRALAAATGSQYLEPGHTLRRAARALRACGPELRGKVARGNLVAADLARERGLRELFDLLGGTALAEDKMAVLRLLLAAVAFTGRVPPPATPAAAKATAPAVQGKVNAPLPPATASQAAPPPELSPEAVDGVGPRFRLSNNEVVDSAAIKSKPCCSLLRKDRTPTAKDLGLAPSHRRAGSVPTGGVSPMESPLKGQHWLHPRSALQLRRPMWPQQGAGAEQGAAGAGRPARTPAAKKLRKPAAAAVAAAAARRRPAPRGPLAEYPVGEAARDAGLALRGLVAGLGACLQPACEPLPGLVASLCAGGAGAAAPDPEEGAPAPSGGGGGGGYGEGERTRPQLAPRAKGCASPMAAALREAADLLDAAAAVGADDAAAAAAPPCPVDSPAAQRRRSGSLSVVTAGKTPRLRWAEEVAEAGGGILSAGTPLARKVAGADRGTPSPSPAAAGPATPPATPGSPLAGELEAGGSVLKVATTPQGTVEHGYPHAVPQTQCGCKCVVM